MMHFQTKEKFIDCGVFFVRKASSGLHAPFYSKEQAYHTVKTA